jgi:cysteinyl-tRNA synthetase
MSDIAITLKATDTWNGGQFEFKTNHNYKIYICGPTVYTHTHIGHLKAYMSFDIVRRIMNYFGITSTYMMNITNVDDKIINGTIAQAKQQKIDVEQLHSF